MQLLLHLLRVHPRAMVSNASSIPVTSRGRCGMHLSTVASMATICSMEQSLRRGTTRRVTLQARCRNHSRAIGRVWLCRIIVVEIARRMAHQGISSAPMSMRPIRARTSSSATPLWIALTSVSRATSSPAK